MWERKVKSSPQYTTELKANRNHTLSLCLSLCGIFFLSIAISTNQYSRESSLSTYRKV